MSAADSLRAVNTAIRRSYVLCATPRTGSYLLADLLRQTGRAGNPTEYFSAGFQQYWQPRWATATYEEYLRRVQEVGTSGGVLGIKAHPRQFEYFARQETGLALVSASDLRAALERWLPSPRYVWLRRRDVLAQAISWARSMQTNVWWDAEEPPAPYDAPTPERLRFDADSLTGALLRMRREDRMWERYFERNSLRPLVVWYEDLAADPASAFADVLEYLGLPELRSVPLAQPRLRRQSDATSARWRSRYRAVCRARVDSTLSACSNVDPGADMLVASGRLERPDGWHEEKHSLLAITPYTGPFRPDYVLATEGADPPPAALVFVPRRSACPGRREVVLHRCWLAVADRDAPATLDRTQHRAAALAAHLGADRIGIVASGGPFDHFDIGSTRVLVLSEEPGGLGVEEFLRLPPRPPHEFAARTGWRVAICVVGPPPAWALALRRCIATQTRHRCDIAGPADAAVLAAADVVFVPGGGDLEGLRAVRVDELPAARLRLTTLGTSSVVSTPVAGEFNDAWDTEWAAALAGAIAA